MTLSQSYPCQEDTIASGGKYFCFTPGAKGLGASGHHPWYHYIKTKLEGKTMARPKRKVAFAKEVSIKREGETAVIDFLDKSFGGTYLTIGPAIKEMSDEEILRLHNEIVMQQQRMIAESQPREMQEGLPQIGIDPYYKELTTHSETLRCELTSGDNHNDLVVEIDDKKLTWEEFGKLVSPYIGWGMRVQFLPTEQLLNPPESQILTSIREE